MPSRISVGSRQAARARTILGLQGGDVPTTVEDALLFVLEVDPDILLRPELAWAGGEYLVHGVKAAAAGGAANLSRVALINPAGSGVIATLDAVVPLNSTSNLIAVGKVLPAEIVNYTQANFAFGRDTRNTRTGEPPPSDNKVGAVDMFIRNNAALLAGENVEHIFPPNQRHERLGLTLHPGHGWQFFPVVSPTLAVSLNIDVIAALEWRVRAILDGEDRT